MSKKRAIEMLRVAARYIRDVQPDGSIFYDEAECDGYCVADDCDAAADDLVDSKETGETCGWAHDEDGIWQTDCGEAFVLMDGTPEENDFRFCCYCGKNLPHWNPSTRDGGHSQETSGDKA